MSNANIIQTNFTAGEISKKLLGRYNIERYKNGVEELFGFIPQIQGGIKSTPMRRHNGEAKNADKKARLIKFAFSRTEANMLEFGDQYIRFWAQDRTQVMDGGSPYEISSPFLEAELFDLEYVGTADTVFIFHENHPIQRLRRFNDNNWVIEDAPIDPLPFDEIGFNPAQTLTLSAATVGAGRTFTAGAAAFLEADVGRRITYLGGVALVTSFTSTTVVVCTIESAFSTASIGSGDWTIQGTPQAICTPSSNGALGETIQLLLSTSTIFEARKTVTSATFDGVASPPEIDFVLPVAHGYSTGDTIQVEDFEPLEYNGYYEMTVTAGSQLSVNYAPDPGVTTKVGTVRKVAPGISTNGWRSSDVGSFVEINGGLVEITAFTSASQVDGIVRKAMTSDVSSQAGAWILKDAIWSDDLGWPRCGTLFQQSLSVGGSTSYPHTFAKSVIGETLSFQLGLDDDDAFAYTLDSEEINPIMHLTKNKDQLIALTSGQEFSLTGGVERPMTPTNVQKANPSDYGSNTVRPVRVDNETLFINSNGKKLRALGYQISNDAFSSPDLTKLSDQILTGGVVDMTYQKEDESIVWLVRSDGVMVTLCIDRSEGILAWCRQLPTTGTTYESTEAMRNNDGVDEVWCIVNTGSNRYIESFDASAPYGLASAISGTSGPGVTVITGLDHLEGETVEVVGDGVILDPQIVSGGQITVERTVFAWFVGLPSHGYVKSLPPEFFTQSGSIQGSNIRIATINIQVLETFALLINDQYRDARKFGSALLDEAPPEVTGLFEVFSQGWQKKGFIEIEQPNALPVHILAIILSTTANPK